MITRRRFIEIGCLFPLALTLDEKHRRCATEEIRERLVGTFVHIKAVGAGAGLLYSAVQYMRGFERFFSRFDPESDLSVLNREGVVRRPGREFIELMEAAAKGYRETEGAFDPTVLPVLFHSERHRKALTASEREGYWRLIGFSKVAVHRDCVYTADRRMKLTLDGIATGYILDKGMEFLRSKGCLEVLINAGGDIYCGKKAGGWRAGIYDPLNDTLSRTLTLETMSVCTSGTYVNYYTEDRAVHHLIDPRTLTSPGELVSATAVARTTLRADMLSTALFVAGKDGGSLLQPGERAYLIARDGSEITLHGA
jgi:FAD:protein FMN transferase